MALTTNQKEAVESRNENILVSASAGSGKTTAMVNRIVSLLEEGASLEEMLIITFTKAAASDMRDKIGKAIIELCGKDERFDRELRLLPSAKIGTIDSWCGAVVKDYFYAADMDADYELIGEGEKRALSDSVVDALSDAAAQSDANFRALYESFVSNRSDDNFKEFIYKMLEYAKTQVDPVEWLLESCKAYENDEAKRAVESAFAKKEAAVKAKLENIKNEAIAVKYQKLAEHCDLVLSDYINGGKTGKFLGEEADYPELNERTEEIKERFKKLTKDKADYGEFDDVGRAGELARAAAEFAVKVYESEKREKKRRAVADYNDVEHGAYKILSSKEGDEIRRGCKYVFVDEYQDVNGLQDALIRAATGEYLFIVGDVKQSIYAFRSSDPDIFLNKMNNPLENGFNRAIEFGENFRSGSKVVDYVNAVFSRIMTTEFGGVDYTKNKLIFNKREDGGEVRLNLLESPEKPEKEAISGVYDVRNYRQEKSQSAADMAAYIAEGIAKRLETPDENGNTVREGDIAVLFRSASPVVKALYELLKKGGTNVFLSRKNYFSSAKPSRDLNHFIKLLAFGEDDVSMLGYLTSPLCGLSEDELFAAAEGGKGGFCRRMRKYARDNDDDTAKKLRAALGRITDYTEKARYSTVSELIGEVIAETDYDVKLRALEEGEVALETLVRFTEYISSLKSASSVVDYVRYLESGDGAYDSPAPPRSLKIMTVHSSKGLQFPYVFLIGCDKKFNESDENARYMADNKYGLCLKTGKKSKKGTFIGNYVVEAAKQRMAKKKKEEEMRLLYVAMTRAEKGLYAYAFDKPTGCDSPEEAECYLDWLLPASGSITERMTSERLKENERDESGENESAEPADESAAKKLRERVSFVYPYESREIKTTVTRMSDEQPVTSIIRTEDDDALMQKGTDYHAIMQRLDFSAPFESERKRLAALFTSEIDEGEIKAAFENVGAIIKEFGGEIYREQSFVVNENGTLVQGVIDLIAINGEDALILDYKLTGAKNLLKDNYVRQINSYADAAESVLNVKVRKLLLYSFTSKTAKTVERSKRRENNS